MKIPPGERDIIKARQQAWATRNGRLLDADGYCACGDDNIFRGLSPGARKDFESGDGTELGKGGGRGKIQVGLSDPRSSARQDHDQVCFGAFRSEHKTNQTPPFVG